MLAADARVLDACSMRAREQLNDGAMFVSGYPFAEYGMTKSSLTSYFSQRFGEERVTTLSTLFTVPGSFPGSPLLSAPFYAAQRCETDFSYACTALWFTKAAPTGSAWTYQFSEPTGFQGLVLHGAEIDYVFGTLSNPSAAQRAVSQTMMAYWARPCGSKAFGRRHWRARRHATLCGSLLTHALSCTALRTVQLCEGRRPERCRAGRQRIAHRALAGVERVQRGAPQRDLHAHHQVGAASLLPWLSLL
jgi:hypothetical protein